MLTVKEKYGFLPESVWHLNKGKFKPLTVDNGIARETRRSGNTVVLPNLKFSSFNPEVARRIILYWSNEGDTILDSFAGRSTRLIVAKHLNRVYVGYEISPVAFKELEQQSKSSQSAFAKMGAVYLHLADGCQLAYVPNDSVDLVFTCPPYWNLKRYESVPNQLSDCKTYDEFLSRLKQWSKRCFDVVKPNKFVAIVVADFRKDGFKALHKDCIDIFTSSGFALWDIVINVLNSAFTFWRIGDYDNQKYTSRIHEYILVFKKEVSPCRS